MGVWSFYGGMTWDGEQFKPNTHTDIEVVDECDREIHLSEFCLMSPGLIDFHCHVWAPGADVGITDSEYLSTGVIAVVDAGTFGYKGWENADRFWRHSAVEIRSWLSVLPEGLTVHPNPTPTSPDKISTESLLKTASTANGRLLGFKIRLGQVDAQTDRGLLKLARLAADQANLHMMVHLTGTFLDIEEVLEYFNAGDVVTHPFHGKRGNIINQTGGVSKAVFSAVERGVLLDIGQGRTHFSWPVFQRALSEGIKPHTISTDLVRGAWRKPPVSDLTHVINRFMAAGITENEIFASMLNTARAYINVEINPTVNLLVLEPHRIPNTFTDSEGNSISGEVEYVPTFYVRNGKAVFA